MLMAVIIVVQLATESEAKWYLLYQQITDRVVFPG